MDLRKKPLDVIIKKVVEGEIIEAVDDEEWPHPYFKVDQTRVYQTPILEHPSVLWSWGTDTHPWGWRKDRSKDRRKEDINEDDS